MEVQGYRVFVGGISWKADEIQLENFFSTHGQVLECKIIMDKVTGKSKGYGFVTFKEAGAAEFVKQTANFNFLGKNMNVGDAVRKAHEPNGGTHNGGSRSTHGGYNGNGYPPYYNNQNYYNRSNDTQFYGHYSPDGTFYPTQYYYQAGFRGNQPYQYGVANFSGGSYPNFSSEEQQPSTPESPPSQSSYPPTNGFSQFSPSSFSPPSFNQYYYNPYYYQYGYSPNGSPYGPGFNNGGFGEGENAGQPPAEPGTSTDSASFGKLDANVHNSVNLPTPLHQLDAAPETDLHSVASEASSSSSAISAPIPIPSSSSIGPSPSIHISSTSSSSASSTTQNNLETTRSPGRGYNGVSSGPKPQQRQQQHQHQHQHQRQPQQQQYQQQPKPKQHRPPNHHRVASQDPSLVHSHVIAGLSKLSVSSN